ncbi:hypothetical protein Tco_1000203 [Tanacetum coccineum]
MAVRMEGNRVTEHRQRHHRHHLWQQNSYLNEEALIVQALEAIALTAGGTRRLWRCCMLQWFYEDDTEILETAKSRCHIIRLQDPVTHEVAIEMETKAQIKLRFKKAAGKDVSIRSFQSTKKASKMEYKVI